LAAEETAGSPEAKRIAKEKRARKRGANFFIGAKIVPLGM
jgi:hypothetical protein